MAGTLLSTGVWCFLVRLPMIHLARGPSRIIVVLSGYIFAAGALTLPTSCILHREHNVTRGRRRTLLPVRSFTIITSRFDCATERCGGAIRRRLVRISKGTVCSGLPVIRYLASNVSREFTNDLRVFVRTPYKTLFPLQCTFSSIGTIMREKEMLGDGQN